MGDSARSSGDKDVRPSDMKRSLSSIVREIAAIAGKYPITSPAERMAYVSAMVDNMLGALRSRDDAEPQPGQCELEKLQTRLRGTASSDARANADSVEREFYALLGTHPTLDTLYSTISYSTSIAHVSRRLQGLEGLSKEGRLGADELLQMERLRRLLGAFEEELKKAQGR